MLRGVASLLRGYGYRRQGSAALEGTIRYPHQGGGQEHTRQIKVPYKPKRWIKEKWEKASKSIHKVHAANALSGQGAYSKMLLLLGRWRSWEKQNKKKIEQHVIISFISIDRGVHKAIWTIHTYIHTYMHTYIHIVCIFYVCESVYIFKNRTD